MPSENIAAYHILRTARKNTKNDLIRELTKVALNAPKIVMQTDRVLYNKDVAAGNAFMNKHGFHIPFDTLVVEPAFDGMRPDRRSIILLRVDHDGEEWDGMPVLLWTVWTQLGDHEVATASGFLGWDMKLGCWAVPHDVYDNPDHKSFSDAAMNVAYALNTIMIQSRTRYIRYATRQRTSRHPLPDHWNAEPFFSYSVVTKERFPNPKAIAEYKSSIQVRQRRHKRMGHWRFYKSGKVIWINEYEAGDARLGYKFKDYELAHPAKPH